jgi:Rod binding domain-containing protein
VTGGAEGLFGPGFGALGERERLERTAQELEAVVLTQLLETMRKSVPETDVFGKAPGHDVFRALLDGEIARKTAERSPFGLADAIVDRLGEFTESVKEGGEPAEETGGPPAPLPSPIRTAPGPPASVSPPRRSWRI